MKSLILFGLVINTAVASDLFCQAWRQKEGQPSAQVALVFEGVHPVTEEREYRVKIEDYLYKVDWNVLENRLYASIVFNSRAHIYGTMMVPDAQLGTTSSLDSTRDDGERVSIDCSMK